MATAERINYFRKLRGMTQKYLGELLGFTGRNADGRIAQYETGKRTPKEDMLIQLADALSVSPQALKVPDIDTYTGLIHTLFALEDMYGMTIASYDGDNVIRLGKKDGKVDATIFNMLADWKNERTRYLDGQITKEEYDEWRYHYPSTSKSGHWAHNPSILDNLSFKDEETEE